MQLRGSGSGSKSGSRKFALPGSWVHRLLPVPRHLQGVTKLMGTAEAQRRCPGLALVGWVGGWVGALLGERRSPGFPVAGLLRVVAHVHICIRCAVHGSRARCSAQALRPPWPHACSGEDLTPYRAASKQMLAVLQRYGTAEKLGLDEVFVDATAEVGALRPCVAGCTFRRVCTGIRPT